MATQNSRISDAVEDFVEQKFAAITKMKVHFGRHSRT